MLLDFSLLHTPLAIVRACGCDTTRDLIMHVGCFSLLRHQRSKSFDPFDYVLVKTQYEVLRITCYSSIMLYVCMYV